MSRNLILLIFLFLFSGAKANPGLNYFIELYRYRTLEGKPYIEVCFSIDGSSVHYKKNKQGFEALIETTILIYKDSTKRIYAESFELTKTIADTSNKNTRFYMLDLRRYPMQEGTYRMEVILVDKQNPQPLNHKAIREFYLGADSLSHLFSFSDISFLSNFYKSSQPTIFTKNGLDLFPYPTGSSMVEEDSLSLYVELYNITSLTSEPYYLEINLTPANSDKVVTKYQKITKAKKPGKFDVFVGSFNIKDLPSQTYLASVFVKNNAGQTLAANHKKFFVYNSNEFTYTGNEIDLYDKLYGYNETELTNYIQTLRYISTPTEASFAQSLSSFDEKKKFFYHFWEKRQENKLAPGKEWRDYHLKIKYANEHFRSSLRQGWETDRGRVLLTYGLPNDIQNYPGEMDKHPYTIWTYNKLGVQSQVLFVFYDPDLSTNEYPLLHSTKYGEYNNQRWRYDLIRQRNGSIGGFDMERLNQNPLLRDMFRDNEINVNMRDNMR
ncbi:MAG: GWxTD domain-containing protein [Bacteroidia bacterium]|nr:GWxTD domain-containing protein [Bacteroidia bacterium]